MATTIVMSRLLIQESNSDYFLRTFMHENGHRHEDEKKEQESRIWGSRNVTFPKRGEDIRECPDNSLNPSTSVNRWDRIEKQATKRNKLRLPWTCSFETSAFGMNMVAKMNRRPERSFSQVPVFDPNWGRRLLGDTCDILQLFGVSSTANTCI